MNNSLLLLPSVMRVLRSTTRRLPISRMSLKLRIIA
nr:MAG TPA: hypothetical protein [Caudoviricetes sp.]